MVSDKELKKTINMIDRFYWQARANEPALRKMSVANGKDAVCTYMLKLAFAELYPDKGLDKRTT